MGSLFRSTKIPPTHFTLIIESFSTLSSSPLHRYESCEFEATGCKWKLALYPNGNINNEDAKDHISLYLALYDKTSLNYLNKHGNTLAFRFFVLDHIRDTYMLLEDVHKARFVKSEFGCDQFLSRKVFNDPSHGYLVNDRCTFGAEVVLLSEEIKGQCLSMTTTNPPPFKYTWKIDNFSKLRDEIHLSPKFTTRGHDWKLQLYPRGCASEKGRILPLYLHLVDSETLLQPGTDVVVQFKLGIVDQRANAKDRNNFEGISCFNSSNKFGSSKCFFKLSDLNESTGYLVNDTCVVVAEVMVLGSARKFN